MASSAVRNESNPAPPEVSEIYEISRSVLLDTVEALAAKKDALIIIGAHAVYINEQKAGRPLNLPVAALTSDCDISLDPSKLGEEPHLEELMEKAGMKRGNNPGDWRTSRKLSSQENVEVAVDLMVADSVGGGKPKSRGARLGFHGKLAARKTLGLEGALIDNEVVKIGALSAKDTREVEVKVAGPTALLVAKLHKIHERKDHRREVSKDALDVLRLLSIRSSKENVGVIKRLLNDERSRDATRTALGYLKAHCSTERSYVPQLAQQAAGVGNPGISRACARYASILLRDLENGGIEISEPSESEA